MAFLFATFLYGTLWLGPACAGEQPAVEAIIERSVAANDADYKAAPDFDYRETDRDPQGWRTFQITMIDGSPYRRLIAVYGRPLSPAQAVEEAEKQAEVTRRRAAESAEARQQRIEKYQADRNRDHLMMAQLTKAFTFELIGRRRVRSFNTWVLKATPRPGYQPPNRDTEVLRGMQGRLWIDMKTYQWVKVTARVIHPVSIEGFLARVELGTQFELEKSPVADGEDNVWEASHFSMRSRARVLFVWNRSSRDDETYFDYKPRAVAKLNLPQPATHDARAISPPGNR